MSSYLDVLALLKNLVWHSAANFLWILSSLAESVQVTEFQKTDAYSIIIIIIIITCNPLSTDQWLQTTVIVTEISALPYHVRSSWGQPDYEDVWILSISSNLNIPLQYIHITPTYYC
jgi:hypothetical protein